MVAHRALVMRVLKSRFGGRSGGAHPLGICGICVDGDLTPSDEATTPAAAARGGAPATGAVGPAGGRELDANVAADVVDPKLPARV